MKSTAIGMVLLNDERPHVYEVNSSQNLQVVEAWAKLIRSRLRNIDGTSPQVVTASRTITDTRIAQEVGDELRKAGCRQVIMVYNVWNFPFLVWPFINSLGSDMPILSLSNNNGKFPGNVGLLATDGALRQAGIRTHRIVGEIGDAETENRVLDWVRAAQSATNIRNEVFGCYGGPSMGMDTGYFHLTAMLKSLGTSVCQIDQFLLVKMMGEVNPDEVEKGFKWLNDLMGERIRYDGRMLTPETLKNQLRLYLAMKMVNDEKGFDYCGLKGQRELTEHVTLGDVPEMLMNDPYDWNGFKEPTVCATEADAGAAVTMQLMKYLAGGLPVLFMDVRLYHRDLDLWDWCNSGNHASYYAARSLNPADNFSKITLHPALEYYFKAGGASVEFDAAPGEMTFARLGIWDEKPYMVILSGESVALSPEQSKALAAQTDPTWPHLWARLNCTFDEFISVFPANHVQGIPGNHVRALAWLCEISGIRPVILGKEGRERIEPIWERI